MINLNLLSSKYNSLINSSKENFLVETNKMKELLTKAKVNFNKPLLVYNNNNKNAFYYIYSIMCSLHKDRVLDYVITTGQHFINQHFLDNVDKDKELYNKIYFDDILFISLSQYDYTSEYLESLLIDLVETRITNNKVTIIYYDILDSKNYLSTTRRLFDYFNKTHEILDLTSPNIVTPKNKQTTSKTKVDFF